MLLLWLQQLTSFSQFWTKVLHVSCYQRTLFKQIRCHRTSVEPKKVYYLNQVGWRKNCRAGGPLNQDWKTLSLITIEIHLQDPVTSVVAFVLVLALSICKFCELNYCYLMITMLHKCFQAMCRFFLCSHNVTKHLILQQYTILVG